jgi:hypothetical protein
MFCLMARSLARSKDIALGGFYRRMADRRGGLIANIALARKLAILFLRRLGRALVACTNRARPGRHLVTWERACGRSMCATAPTLFGVGTKMDW